jgi:hypothetical protein
MAKRKRTNNDLQNTKENIKGWASRTPLKAGVNSCTPEGSAVPALLMTPVVLLLDMEIVLDTSLRKQVQIL